jgi:hypothetical protein
MRASSCVILDCPLAGWAFLLQEHRSNNQSGKQQASANNK